MGIHVESVSIRGSTSPDMNRSLGSELVTLRSSLRLLRIEPSSDAEDKEDEHDVGCGGLHSSSEQLGHAPWLH